MFWKKNHEIMPFLFPSKHFKISNFHSTNNHFNFFKAKNWNIKNILNKKFSCKSLKCRAEDIAQKLRALATFIEDLSSIPGSHMSWLKTTTNSNSRDATHDFHRHLHLCVHIHTRTYTHMHIYEKKNLKSAIFYLLWHHEWPLPCILHEIL